jgi:hypothetical protein
MKLQFDPYVFEPYILEPYDIFETYRLDHLKQAAMIDFQQKRAEEVQCYQVDIHNRTADYQFRLAQLQRNLQQELADLHA